MNGLLVYCLRNLVEARVESSLQVCLYPTTVIRDDDSACLDGRPRLLLTWLVNTCKMDTFLEPYPSTPFSLSDPSLNLKAMAPLCIPPFVHSNNQPTRHRGIHHHRAEGFGGRAPRVESELAAWIVGVWDDFRAFASYV